MSDWCPVGDTFEEPFVVTFVDSVVPILGFRSSASQVFALPTHKTIRTRGQVLSRDDLTELHERLHDFTHLSDIQAAKALGVSELTYVRHRDACSCAARGLIESNQGGERNG